VLRIQDQCLPVIHLSCERDQKHLLSEAETGFHVWDILADTYASSGISSVMRLKELFGKAKFLA